MKISFNQPAFIPWCGVYARLLATDKMILLDDTLFARGFTFVNRNRLKNPDGETWITLPVKKKGRGRQRINELEIHEKEIWAKKFLTTLRYNYGKSIYFENIFNKIKSIVQEKNNNFLFMILKMMELIKNEFGIEQEFILQSELGIKGKGTELILKIAKELQAEKIVFPFFAQKHIKSLKIRKESINISFLRYSSNQYPQFWGSFRKKLSALDLLLCLGKSGKKLIKKNSIFYGI